MASPRRSSRFGALVALVIVALIAIGWGTPTAHAQTTVNAPTAAAAQPQQPQAATPVVPEEAAAPTANQKVQLDAHSNEAASSATDAAAAAPAAEAEAAAPSSPSSSSPSDAAATPAADAADAQPNSKAASSDDSKQTKKENKNKAPASNTPRRAHTTDDDELEAEDEEVNTRLRNSHSNPEAADTTTGRRNPPRNIPSTPRRGSGSNSGQRRAERLLFEDNFDELDTSKWEHELTLGGGGNWEFQWYTNNRTNSYVRDGVLYMRPTFTQDFLGGDESLLRAGSTIDLWGSTPADVCTGNAFYGCSRSAGGGGNIINPIQSARLRSSRSFSFKYGRVEIRAQLPKGDWIWPALWMLPRWNQYGGWPASGEIDIMESRGNSPGTYPNIAGVGGGHDSYSSTLHWGANWASNQYERTHGEHTSPGGSLADDFHTFGLLWTEDGIISYIDDESNKVLDVSFKDGQSMWDKSGLEQAGWNNPWEGRPNHAPFDQEFFLLMNVAVGGTGSYFPDGLGGKPWTNKDEHAVNAFWNARGAWQPTWKGEDVAMKIDWVRVYEA